MKIALRAVFVLSLGITILLIERSGAQSIFGLLARVGWLLLLLVPLHAIPLLLDVLGWRALIPAPSRVPTLFLIACVREAINRLLPVANVGGEIAGVRLLAARGYGFVTAASSVIVETLMTLVTQFLFVAFGVACLLEITDAALFAGRVLWGLVAALPALALLIALLRNGSIFKRLGQLSERLLGSGFPAGMAGEGTLLDAAIRDLLAAHGRCLRAIGWQFLGLAAGTAETWIALRWLGHPVGFAAALALESLTQVARHFIFIVPAGLGVQEASLIGVGQALGLGMDVAMALSLAKRSRELLFGLPALAAWQWFDFRASTGRPRSK